LAGYRANQTRITRRHSSTHKQATDTPPPAGFFLPGREAVAESRRMQSRRAPPRRLPQAAARILLLGLLGAAAAAGAAPGSGLRSDVIFSDYPPEASGEQLVQRLLSPLAAAQIERTLNAQRHELSERSVDLAAEKFTVYVPAAAPPLGYALLVFIPPWPEARLPQGWQGVLERNGTIFVSATRSGNESNDLTRRAPLALIAALNLERLYPVDSTRVYVGGFSGGARVALRLALAYPDVFRGALLNAGSDPIDAGPPSPPGPPTLTLFQQASRIVYVTGERDVPHLSMDEASVDSLRRWCMFDFRAEVTARAAHEVADGSAFAGALHALLQHTASAPAKVSACNQALEKQLSGQLAQVATAIAGGERAAAQKALLEIDRRFGGLAAPRSLELEAQLGWDFGSAR
jgi:predicted esterase